MTPQKQLTKTDCLRACIATLLDQEISSVPDFVGGNFTEQYILDIPEEDQWWFALQGWLAIRGLFLQSRDVCVIMSSDGSFNLDQPGWHTLPFAAVCMAIGETEKGKMHMVIATAEGSRIVPQFDPLPSVDAGSHSLHILRAVCFLVPRDIGSFVRSKVKIAKIEKLAKELREGPLKEAILEECKP